jgi:hypothetical protein
MTTFDKSWQEIVCRVETVINDSWWFFEIIQQHVQWSSSLNLSEAQEVLVTVGQ